MRIYSAQLSFAKCPPLVSYCFNACSDIPLLDLSLATAMRQLCGAYTLATSPSHQVRVAPNLQVKQIMRKQHLLLISGKLKVYGAPVSMASPRLTSTISPKPNHKKISHALVRFNQSHSNIVYLHVYNCLAQTSKYVAREAWHFFFDSSRSSRYIVYAVPHHNGILLNALIDSPLPSSTLSKFAYGWSLLFFLPRVHERRFFALLALASDIL